jgi:4a-hydroxytetrahydrobiopterin dehydratase
MTRQKLDDQALATALQELPGWKVQEGKLHKEFKFASFAAAMGWMMEMAVVIDKLDHHPEWSNVYNKVRVNLVTHDLGNAISDLDVDLARRMEEAAK